MHRLIVFALGTVALAGTSLAGQDVPVRAAGTSQPLFASHDLLELTVEAPLRSVLRERTQESAEYPATISYLDGSGNEVVIDLEISTRGRRRLDRNICRFPPLQLDFPRSEVGETIFANQNNLKLVTHCQDGRSEYEQYVLQEYLVYRAFNLLTDLSFRVRLARITYIDLEQDRDAVTKYAFLIEHKDLMAKRNGWEVLEVPIIEPGYLDPDQLSLVEVFQYMIGNTDWSAFRAPSGETECCHNAKAVGDVIGPVFTVPFDFDQAGVIRTRYAKPDARFNLRNVGQRLYRGVCRPRQEFDPIRASFNEQKDAIYALYRAQQDLDPKRLERMLDYYDDFYDIINNEGKFRREILNECRRMGGGG